MGQSVPFIISLNWILNAWQGFAFIWYHWTQGSYLPCVAMLRTQLPALPSNTLLELEIDCFEPIFEFLVQFHFQKYTSGTWEPKGMFSAPSGCSVTTYNQNCPRFVVKMWWTQGSTVFSGTLFLGKFYTSDEEHDAPVLKEFEGHEEPIVLTLPNNVKVKDLKWISVWDRTWSLSYGDMIWDDNELLQTV